MSQMDTDGGPQADGEVKSNICYWQKTTMVGTN